MAHTFLNTGIPVEVCEKEPALLDTGFYRRLNSGKYEFISFCDPRAKNWLSVHRDDFSRILDQLLPKKR